MPRIRSSFLVVAGIFLVFPFFLRRRPRVESRITVLAGPEEIFERLNDLSRWSEWTAWGREEEIKYSYGEVTAGVGAEQRWTTGRSEGVLKIVRSELNSRIDYELEIDHGAYLIRGRFDLMRDGQCTRVSWRCVWDLARNPYLRYGDMFFQWMLRRDFGKGLSQLKAAVESARLPQFSVQ